ncbi:MAG: GNAT family N-acetyltransferase [Actinomycetota bacterium]|nr:GNAT family N-acetyltransferase [Actinomycetota bacterium]
MSTSPLTFREASVDDAEFLAGLVRTAYRGGVGWTTEAALLDDQRIDAAGVAAKIVDPDGAVLVGLDGSAAERVVACCEVVHRGDGLAYFGMFAVDPARQAAGLGRRVLGHAEAYAARRWAAHTMEMTVIAQRAELISWYERRGYTVTDETRPFPYDQMVGGGALRDDLHFRVLVKLLPR